MPRKCRPCDRPLITCWKCGEFGYLYSSSLEKKPLEVWPPPALSAPLVKYVMSISPLMGILTTGIGVVKPPVWSDMLPPFHKKQLPAGKVGIAGRWKTRGKLRTTRPQFPETPTSNDTHSPFPATISKADDLASYAEKLRTMKIRYEPSFEEKEKLEQRKAALNSKRRQ